MSHPTELERLLSLAEASEEETSASAASGMPSRALSAQPERALRPVLALLSADRVPQTACRTCEASCWHSTSAGLHAYCKVTHSIVFSPDFPMLIEDCDQLHLPIDN
ncbi:MAG: hypothetical protein C0423_01845 [Methylibium sp.]|nr:hypothetical protein [Methylibium sp.]